MFCKLSKFQRSISVSLILVLVFELLPNSMMALTSGPNQPEYTAFEPAGASEMVNLFTGDFTYNIPLMDVDGYPLNISYHGGVNMEQEASWVGLGWSLNPGSINRAMRGLPDDFNGQNNENLQMDINIKNQEIFSVDIGGGAEIVGLDGMGTVGASMGMGIIYNNYKGLGYEFTLGTSGSLQLGECGTGCGMNAGANIKISSQDGVDFTAAAGLGVQAGYQPYGGVSQNIGVSTTINSRTGVTYFGFNGSQGYNIGPYSTAKGHDINLIPNTAYVPNMQFGTTATGGAGEIHVGGQIPFCWANVYGTISGSYTEQKLQSQSVSVKGYGYLNMEHANKFSATDFNRDKDGVYYLECPKLPAAALTYDYFSANAQGLSIPFRSYRNDVGTVYDNYVSSESNNYDGGLEVNLGGYFELGGNYTETNQTSHSGVWNNMINTTGIGNFKTKLHNNLFEQHHFKSLNEYNFSDDTYDDNVGKDQLSRFQLSVPSSSSNTADLTSSIITTNSVGVQTVSSALSPNALQRQSRVPRTNNISYLTASEADLAGFDKEIRYFPFNNYNDINATIKSNLQSSYTTTNRYFSGMANANHISEVTITKDDGARYIFGIPIYNTNHEETIFNVSRVLGSTPSGSCIVAPDNSFVTYSAGTDNSISNNRGLNNYYNNKKIQNYAHTYLLTNLLSSDYVDKTGNGASDDDLGNYVKFNYSRRTGYKWRIPYESQHAMYVPNLKADQNDDLGSYVYGEKDMWFPNSIVTKNYVAVFYTRDRNDGLGVSGKDGGQNTSVKPVCLDKISIFAKNDFINNPNPNAVVPIKTVHFVYDNSLCPGIPNNSTVGQGKLTLKKIYFTYGNSDKGIYNSYQFNYGDYDDDGTTDASPNMNPTYNHAHMDRWGTFQDVLNLYGYTYNNFDYSYTVQDKFQADNNAKVWQLSTIITPAGSKIRVDYEADDYAYVQDKKATQMALIESATSSGTTFNNDGTTNYSTLYDDNQTPLYYLKVDLSYFNGGITTSSSGSVGLTQANNILRNIMLPADNNLYFNAQVQLGGTSDNDTWEHVPGYAVIDKVHSQVIDAGTNVFKEAVIALRAEDIDDANSTGDYVNPISKAAWQMTRLMLPQIAYPGSEPLASGSGNQFFQALVGLAGSLSEVLTFNQKNGRLRSKGYASQLDPHFSFVRLTNPNMFKYGGGHRVKKITIQDGWFNATNQNSTNNSSENTSIYGQTYDYTMEENGQTISSGVASYEPLLGGDENSCRTRLADYSVKHVMAPNDQHFIENPIGEPFYPSPLVGYRKITVRNIDHYDNDQSYYTSSTPPAAGAPIGKPSGYTTYEFYTAKDFPIKSEMSAIDSYHYKPDPSTGIFENSLTDDVYLNQGFLIKLNNMHGKPKSAQTFQEGQSNPISGIKYYYKTNATVLNELDNSVYVVGPDNQISPSPVHMGRNIEAVADFREQITSTYANQYSGNINVSPIPPFEISIPIPSYFQGTTSDLRSFQSSVFSKIVTQQGIIDSVETIEDYTHTISKNLLWDKNTGEVVVSQEQNEFNDPVYTFHYPSYWVNQGMGPAYQNIGFVISGSNIDISTGQIYPTSIPPANSIHEGDEVYLTINTSSGDVPYTAALSGFSGKINNLWITKDSGTGNFYLTAFDGSIITNGSFSSLTGITGFTIKIIRSGFRNMQTIPVGLITSLKNFISGTQLDVAQTGNKSILEANVTEFSDARSPYCYSGLCPETTNDTCAICTRMVSDINSSGNPYWKGTLGNYYPKTHYNYLVNRDEQITSSNEFNIRKDGAFDIFKPFWQYTTTTSSWLPVYSTSRADYSSSKPIDNWFITNEVTKVSIDGHVLESRDAISRYSSALDGYNRTLKKAESVNAKYREIGFDGFEDYSYIIPNKNMYSGQPFYCPQNHFEFYQFKGLTTTTEAHTGRYSMRVPYGVTNVSLVKQFNDTDNCATTYTVNPGGGGGGGTGGGGGGTETDPTYRTYTPQEQCNCIPEFSPISNLNHPETYVLSFWTKETTYPSTGSYVNGGVSINLSYTSSNITPSKIDKSIIIDGWQKFDYYFDIPPSIPLGETLTFTLLNNSISSSNMVYYDDIRIHPFNATMQSIVYDPVSLRLWSTLDDRNFAIFYEYDNEGTLVRTKKETEKGIQTIQEKRHSLIKK